jgi:hypothetical protein
MDLSKILYLSVSFRGFRGHRQILNPASQARSVSLKLKED